MSKKDPPAGSKHRLGSALLPSRSGIPPEIGFVNPSIVLALTYAKSVKKEWKPFAALEPHEQRIEEQLQLKFQHASAKDIDSAIGHVRANNSAFIFIAPAWDVGLEECTRLIQTIKTESICKAIIFLDTCDATASPYLPLLDEVDLFVKPYVFRDAHLYGTDYIGGYIFTDFLARDLGWTLNGWYFGSHAPAHQLDKLCVGWSYGASSRIEYLAKRAALLPVPWSLRIIDLNRRFRPPNRGYEEWYERYRKLAASKVEEIRPKIRTSGYDRLGYKRYLFELMGSKLALSPFGWGEVCIRDFEIVACGALLIKPDTDHVRTTPDIFRAYETYVPVKWDFSDLAETVHYYLAHPKEATQIARAARASLLAYYDKKTLFEDVRSYFATVGKHPEGKLQEK